MPISRTRGRRIKASCIFVEARFVLVFCFSSRPDVGVSAINIGATMAAHGVHIVTDPRRQHVADGRGGYFRPD